MCPIFPGALSQTASLPPSRILNFSCNERRDTTRKRSMPFPPWVRVNCHPNPRYQNPSLSLPYCRWIKRTPRIARSKAGGKDKKPRNRILTRVVYLINVKKIIRAGVILEASHLITPSSPQQQTQLISALSCPRHCPLWCLTLYGAPWELQFPEMSLTTTWIAMLLNLLCERRRRKQNVMANKVYVHMFQAICKSLLNTFIIL
jgi:hypothetical protein